MRIKEISMGRIAPSANKIVRIDPCRVAHTYKPSTQEKAAGEMLSLRPACVKLYHMKILSQRDGMVMSETENHTAETGRQFSHKDKAPSVYQEVIDTAKFCRPGSFGALSSWFGGFKHHVFQWL